MWWYVFYLQNIRDSFWNIPMQGPGHFWSLAVEEHFYLFWPLVVLLLRRRGLVFFSLALIVIAPAVRAVFVAKGLDPFFTLSRMDALALGGLLAVLLTDPVRWLKVVDWTYRLVLPVGIPAFLSSFWLSGSQNHPIIQTLKFSLFAILSAMILILAVSSGPLNPIPAICRMRWLRSMGKTSYAMYVFHPFVFAPILGVLYTAGWSPLRGRTWIDLPIDFVLCIGCTVLASRISWAVLEHPLIKLKDRFQYQEKGESLRQELAPAHPVDLGAATLTQAVRDEAS
jgi:peptidoglycan/LPS O-acetylase OafA/YrhL